MDCLNLIGRSTNLFEEDLSNLENKISRIIKSSNILVIGGAGSIGQAVSIEICKRDPNLLHIIDISENNLVELNSRLEKIGLIENIYVQEFNNEYVNLKIKYLGKLNKIINLLKSQNIILKLSGEEWTLEIIG